MTTLKSNSEKGSSKYRLLFLLAFILFSLKGNGQQSVNPAASNDYFTIESYYKVKWGHAAEFINLWKKNHYPLLKKAMDKGDIISIKVEKPMFHSGEETRWDYRMTIVFKTIVLAFDENLVEPYKKQLFPDQAAYAREEQRRFEILLAHWDVEIATEPLK